ncbi:MAG TPA: decaprenylphospho-beta-D-erythro-pentofuranosid-2-ulose 2-reductase [Acidimicrobiaceae bacterium]|nr:decaprenylphospho-beta-D-erythro-pentofuranosid-2-ulose 2-reductase [Acidimicrobiaceae bacterium]
MHNALHEPQSILLLGGTSDIGLAIVREVLSPATQTVVLACRDTAAGEVAAAGLRHDGLTVDVVPFDGARPDTHEAVVADVVARHGDIDLAVVAFAVLGDGAATSRDLDAAVAMAAVNFTGSVGALVALGNQMRGQGHGSIVVLSSVAGERVRPANAVYGATKAGLDGFAQALGDELAGEGVHVMVVRPGFVHSAMTKGLKAAPFATTPEAVASVVAKGLRGRRRMVWAPGVLRLVFMVLRHVPGPVWRRLPLG